MQVALFIYILVSSFGFPFLLLYVLIQRTGNVVKKGIADQEKQINENEVNEDES